MNKTSKIHINSISPFRRGRVPSIKRICDFTPLARSQAGQTFFQLQAESAGDRLGAVEVPRKKGET